jgi:PAS domain S-box-containing protein
MKHIDPDPESSSDLLGAILDASLEAVVAMDQDGRIREWNSTAESMFGWARNEAIGRTVAETIVPPRYREAHTSALRRFRESGVAHILGRRVSIEALHRSGREFPVELRITPLRSGPTRLLAFISDMTAVRRLEDEQRESLVAIDAQRRLFETILNHAPAGIALVSRRNYVFEFVNPAFLAISPGRVMLGRPALEVWSEIAERLETLFGKVLETGEPYHARDELFSLRAAPDGPLEDRWFTFTFVPVRTKGTDIDALLIVATETTEQVRSRQQAVHLAKVARRRATELRGIIDHMTEAVFVCDANGWITLINSAGAALVGFEHARAEELTLKDLADRLGALSREGKVSPRELPLSLALRGEPIVRMDTVLRSARTGEMRYVRSTAAAIRDADGAILGAVEVARDLTDVERLDRMRSEFVRAAAHELNTPIAVVAGYAQAMARHPENLPKPVHHMLEAMHRGIDRMQAIVRDLSYVTSIEIDKLELSRVPLRLDETIERIVARITRVRPAARVKIVHLEPVTIEFDRQGLEQILHNLLSNALRYSKPDRDVEVSVTAADNEAVLSVRDYGAGIAADRQRHIFERFFRAHIDTQYDFEGMGIGLYISREIVTRQGGRMWFESTEGKGSVFHVAFPIQRKS